MDFEFIEREVPYENFTIRPNFLEKKPPYLVAFRGPANITKEGLCDLDDIKGDEPFIKGYMLHFIGEFNISLEAGVWRQLEFARIVEKSLKHIQYKQRFWVPVRYNLPFREGNDIYLRSGDGKLTVSIVSPSVKGTVLFHFGINLKKVEGYPFAYLEDHKFFPDIDIPSFAEEIMKEFEKCVDEVIYATKKVREVRDDGQFTTS